MSGNPDTMYGPAIAFLGERCDVVQKPCAPRNLRSSASSVEVYEILCRFLGQNEDSTLDHESRHLLWDVVPMMQQLVCRVCVSLCVARLSGAVVHALWINLFGLWRRCRKRASHALISRWYRRCVVTTVGRMVCSDEKSSKRASKARAHACSAATGTDSVSYCPTPWSIALKLFSRLRPRTGCSHAPTCATSAAPRSPCVACSIHGLLGLLLRMHRVPLVVQLRLLPPRTSNARVCLVSSGDGTVLGSRLSCFTECHSWTNIFVVHQAVEALVDASTDLAWPERGKRRGRSGKREKRRLIELF